MLHISARAGSLVICTLVTKASVKSFQSVSHVLAHDLFVLYMFLRRGNAESVSVSFPW